MMRSTRTTRVMEQSQYTHINWHYTDIVIYWNYVGRVQLMNSDIQWHYVWRHFEVEHHRYFHVVRVLSVFIGVW